MIGVGLRMKTFNTCRERDLNPRTTIRVLWQSTSFDQAWISLRNVTENIYNVGYITYLAKYNGYTSTKGVVGNRGSPYMTPLFCFFNGGGTNG